MSVTITITTTCECCSRLAITKTLEYETVARLVDYPRQFTKEVWGLLSTPRGEGLPATYCSDCAPVDHRLHPGVALYGWPHGGPIEIPVDFPDDEPVKVEVDAKPA